MLIDEIDTLIKAELPADNPQLCGKIKKFMTHPYTHLDSNESQCNRAGNVSMASLTQSHFRHTSMKGVYTTDIDTLLIVGSLPIFQNLLMNLIAIYLLMLSTLSRSSCICTSTTSKALIMPYSESKITLIMKNNNLLMKSRTM